MKMVMALFVVLFLSGCASTPAVNPMALIHNGASAASIVGLTAYGKKHQEDAAMVAKIVKTIVENDVLPYLNDNAMQISSDALNILLSQKFNSLSPEIKAFISVAAGVLDAYLPVPKVGTLLNVDQVCYLKAFFTGLDEGTAAFIDGSRETTKDIGKPGAWLNLEAK